MKSTNVNMNTLMNDKIARFAEHAYTESAKVERSMTRIAIATGDSREELQEYREELVRMTGKSGAALEPLMEGFKVLRRDTRLSLDEVKEVFPLVAKGCQGRWYRACADGSHRCLFHARLQGADQGA